MGQDFIVVDGGQENYPSMFSKDILSADSLSPAADNLPEYVQRVAYKSNQQMVQASKPNTVMSQPQYTLKADWYVAQPKHETQSRIAVLETSKLKSPDGRTSDGAYEASQSGCQRSSPTQEDDVAPDVSSSQLKSLSSHDLKVFHQNVA